MSAKGKIGRIPYETRQLLHERMRDGDADVEIVTWLNSLPEVKAALKEARFGGGKQTGSAITPQNISEYRKREYQAWLDGQDKIDRIKAMAEFSLQLAHAAGGDVSSPGVAIAAGKIMEGLELADGEDLLAMAETLAKLNKTETDKVRAKTDQSRLAIQRDALALEHQKFERQTSELFIKWYGDKRANEIVNSNTDKDAKIDQIRQLMFGEIVHATT
jgi:hypothetical protein